jgi:hypothetical protein
VLTHANNLAPVEGLGTSTPALAHRLDHCMFVMVPQRHALRCSVYVCVQVPTMFMSGFLLMRALFLAAANLTVNEWMNRHRYVHLHYTGAGFSNRFDRGVAANCYDFWCGPKLQDYWHIWEAGEQVRNTQVHCCLQGMYCRCCQCPSRCCTLAGCASSMLSVLILCSEASPRACDSRWC